MKPLFSLLLLGAIVVAISAAEAKLIGQSAPPWQLTHWLNSKPLELKVLNGTVVLVRCWPAPQCHLCRATAPALNEFSSDFKAKGLGVVGEYHQKVTTPLDPRVVDEYAGQDGFEFPVAIDTGWRTFYQWLNTDKRPEFTRVSFLLDRKGVVRHLHPGGQYVKGEREYAAIKAKIVELLAEN